MKVIFISYLFFISTLGYGQSLVKEFEGRVHYQNTFIIKDPSIDSIDLIKNLGISSVYTYQAGRFLWASQGSIFQYEIYDSRTGILVDKYSDTDTLKVIDVFKKADSLIYYKIVKSADVICGYVCDAIEFRIQSLIDKKITKRTIFYSPELYVDPKYFSNYRSYANHQVYPITQSVPLRLVTEYDGFPVTIIISAERVELKKINDSEFDLK